MAARPLAYSYAGFSTKEQAKADAFVGRPNCGASGAGSTGGARHRPRDDGRRRVGVNGSHRADPVRHALAAFLQLVRAGHITRGSYLIVESLDRLTHEHVQPALMLVLGLHQAGVRVVQLLPSGVVYSVTSDMVAVMMMMLELSR